MKNLFKKAISLGVTLSMVISFPALAIGPDSLDPTISIETINGETQFDFVCPTDPLFNPVVITGSGAGSAPPGNIGQYAVRVDWGDGTVENGLGTFVPDTPGEDKGNFTFSYTAGPHNYTLNQDFFINVRLYHTQPPGNDNQADDFASVIVCLVPEPPHLTLIKEVINDDQGTLKPSDFLIYLKIDDQDVAGSPASGSETGTVYELAAGAYVVSEDPVQGYTQSFSGDCDSEGNISLAPDESKTCTITNNDIGIEPECEPGQTQVCDTGELGICGAGSQTCNQDGFWAECRRDNEPSDEICDNQLDDNCDGYIDCHDESCYENSVCQKPCCGNGILDDGEECDDGNNENGDGCSAVCMIEEEPAINPGDIVINEIMQNPEAVPDCDGEWFELYNTTESDIELEGCLIRDNGSDSHTIGTSLIVPAGGFAVLARNGNPLENGGISPDYVYSGINLTNGADETILECGQEEIDRVEYDGGLEFPDPHGASMILAHPGLDNNLGSNWCTSSSLYGEGDLGTPASQNDSCEMGAVISGCKYNDLNNDGEIGEEEKLAGWTIILEKLIDEDWQEIASVVTQEEGEFQGCYFFEELEPGNYKVSESLESQAGWLQTYPSNPSYWEISLEQSQLLSDVDFANYFPFCGNSILDTDEKCDDGNNEDGDGCSAICTIETGPGPGPEQPEQECTPGESRICDTDNLGICSAGTQTCNENGFWAACLQNRAPAAEICNNGLDDDCDGYIDGNDSNCEIIPSSSGGRGGGLAVILVLVIFNERNGDVANDTVTVSWQTNQFATSRVIYDTVSHSSLAGVPNYGYAYSTEEDSTKITYHTVTIRGLAPETTYYWRPVSHSSPVEVIGKEMVFTIPGLPIIEGPEEELVGQIPAEAGAEEAVLVPPTGGEEGEEKEIAESEGLGLPEFKEEKPKMGLGALLAAIGGFFDLANICWLLFLLVVILTILSSLSVVRKKKEEQEKRQWYVLPILGVLLIILYYLYCPYCWVLILIVAAIIFLSFLLFSKKKE